MFPKNRYNSLPRSGVSVVDTDIYNRNQYLMDFSEFLGIHSGYVKPQQSVIDDHDKRHFFDSNDGHKPYSIYISPSLNKEKSNIIKYNFNSLSKSPLNLNMDSATSLYKQFNNSKNTKDLRSFHICRLFFPSIVLFIIIMTMTAFLIFESNTELFDSIRHAPEITAFRDDYYLPLKQFIKGNVIN